MEIKVKANCNCRREWNDLDVPPVLGAPFWCEEHGDTEISEIDIFGAKNFFVRDTDGNWHNQEGEIVEEAELITLLESLAEEDYEVLPFFSKSPFNMILIYNKKGVLR